MNEGRKIDVFRTTSRVWSILESTSTTHFAKSYNVKCFISKAKR